MDGAGFGRSRVLEVRKGEGEGVEEMVRDDVM